MQPRFQPYRYIHCKYVGIKRQLFGKKSQEKTQMLRNNRGLALNPARVSCLHISLVHFTFKESCRPSVCLAFAPQCIISYCNSIGWLFGRISSPTLRWAFQISEILRIFLQAVYGHKLLTMATLEHVQHCNIGLPFWSQEQNITHGSCLQPKSQGQANGGHFWLFRLKE